MAHFEIERRWLPKTDYWREIIKDSAYIRQAYLSIDPACTTRIRFESGKKPVICVKGKALMLKTPEFEEKVGDEFARGAFAQAGKERRIVKVRHTIEYGLSNVLVVVDEYLDRHAGLVLIEVEFPNEESARKFVKPEWFGDEVTDDHRYRNAVLVQEGIPTDRT